MIKKLAIAAVALLALAGCSGEGMGDIGNDGGAGSAIPHRVTLDDGRTVQCVVFVGYNKGAISCDWEAAK